MAQQQSENDSCGRVRVYCAFVCISANGASRSCSGGMVFILKSTTCEPRDIANATLYLASDDAKYISGHNLVVDGGLKGDGNGGSIYSDKRTRTKTILFIKVGELLK
ncbi:hypothetical protein K1719_042252 [Acacia pycnantha]|nr:hypothetical protein K1719_042252 [Acacia pycnantha]